MTKLPLFRMMDALDDQGLVEIAKSRTDEKGVPVSLDDL